MPLTPYDIHNKEFKRSFRGYDVDEVNDFLDQIIKDFELLTREKLELEQQVEDLQAELERLMEGDSMFQTSPQPAVQPQSTPQHQLQPRYQQEPMHALQPSAAALSSMEQSIHKSIRVAQEVAEEVRLNAKKEAELIVQEAEKNADRIINEALQKARAVHSELLDLKQKATVYRARFRTLVQSHLDILENSDWESLEELETNLEETGKKLEQYAERNQSPEVLMEQQTQEFHNSEFRNQEYPNMEDTNVMDEVAASYLEEEDEPRRELRRTSRKLKKKAMF
ncbi:DivIVA domain-containing protein [Lihuaxuella thermophila]|uniref:Cell division initiation protein n=1 Tax=Lihuaxuella thermophila TaxID=1173111 RepID=A0A1H8DQX9_9BACL|nr:cell division initiation protein [Lihuaxuella thermophila]